MALISLSVAEEGLGDHVQAIRSAMFSAVEDYRKYPASILAIHGPTTAANCIHDHIKDRISRYAISRSDEAKVQTIRRMFLLIIQDRFAVRFKKLDDDLETANQFTKQVKSFKRQMPLTGLPVMYHLEAGYQLDTIRQPRAAFILCPSGDHSYKWVWEIKDVTITPVVEDIFDHKPPVLPDDDSERPSEVRPKQPAEVVPLRPDKPKE